MSAIDTRNSYELLRSFAFESPDRCAAIPKGMHSGSGSGSGRRYSGRAAAGSTSESFIVLCLDERRSRVMTPTGRTALLHIVTPNDNNLLLGLAWSEQFDVETLALGDRTPNGLIAAHQTSIPLNGSTRSHAILSHVSSMSGDPSCPKALRSSIDLVDLDWQEAGVANFDRFAAAIVQMQTEFESRWS